MGIGSDGIVKLKLAKPMWFLKFQNKFNVKFTLMKSTFTIITNTSPTFFTTQETIILKEYRNVDNYFNVFPRLSY
jgi:hypothetical protein